jgi:hypothetical protein
MFVKSINIICLLAGLFNLSSNLDYNKNCILSVPNELIKGNGVILQDTNEFSDKNISFQNLQTFLQNPLDLQKYKIGTEGRCNSGFAAREKYYYKPSYKGIYWTYFLCRNLSRNKSGNTQLQVVVYKKGQVGGYMDSKDSLISLSNNEQDSTMNEADIVGRHYKAFVKKYGEAIVSKDGLFFYQAKNKMSLLIYVDKGNRITWFTFVRLNRMINSFDEIPDKMKKFPITG